MEVILTVFRYIIAFPLELLAAVVTFALPLERKRHYRLRVVLVLLILAAVAGSFSVIATYVMPEQTAQIETLSHDSGFNTLVWCSVLFLWMVLTVLFVWDVPLREALYCAAGAYLMEHMAYCVRLLLSAVCPPLPLNVGSWMYYTVIAAVYIGVYFLFVRRMVRDWHYDTTAVDSVGLAMGVLTVVMVMSIAATSYGFETVHGIYALICCIYLLVVQLKQQEQLRLQQELGLQQQLWLRHKAQLEMARENIDIINRKCHDLKHQVAALKHIHDPAQRSAVIDSLQDSVMIYDAILKTGNEILDTVLTEKSLLCGQNGIQLTCIADGSLLSFMDAVELYTLFGNAMDNAIEAVLPLPEEERMIDLQVRQKAGLILIRITNRFAGSLDMGEGLPKTSKEDDGYHGFGLKTIRAVAEKHGGILSLHADDSLFTLRITIPMHR